VGPQASPKSHFGYQTAVDICEMFQLDVGHNLSFKVVKNPAIVREAWNFGVRREFSVSRNQALAAPLAAKNGGRQS
jgi:hypothetical protein